MPANKKSGLTFIFVTVLIDCIGFGVIIPIIPKLIETLIGGDLNAASKYGGWLLFSYAIMQFFFAPFFGALSDKYGRRPILLVSLFGMGLDYLFLAFAPTIFWLFIGRIISGITGASITTASAYIADVSTPEKRSQNFGLIGAAFGLGFIIGPVISGLTVGFGLRVPFMIAAGLSLLNWLYGYFILPESLQKENRRAFEWKRANPWGALKKVSRYKALIGLLSSVLLLYIAAQATQSTWTYYTMQKFKWDERLVAYSLGFVGLTVAIVQGGLIRIIIPKLGNKKSIFIGMLLYAIGFLLFAIADKGWLMFAFMIPYALAGISGPALQGLISNQIAANEQGELQGIMAGLMSVSSIIGPILMTGLFAYFTAKTTALYLPSAPFLMACFLTCIALVVCYRSLKRNY